MLRLEMKNETSATAEKNTLSRLAPVALWLRAGFPFLFASFFGSCASEKVALVHISANSPSPMRRGARVFSAPTSDDGYRFGCAKAKLLPTTTKDTGCNNQSKAWFVFPWIGSRRTRARAGKMTAARRIIIYYYCSCCCCSFLLLLFLRPCEKWQKGWMNSFAATPERNGYCTCTVRASNGLLPETFDAAALFWLVEYCNILILVSSSLALHRRTWPSWRVLFPCCWRIIRWLASEYWCSRAVVHCCCCRSFCFWMMVIIDVFCVVSHESVVPLACVSCEPAYSLVVNA
jgi:hypothetical protein